MLSFWRKYYLFWIWFFFFFLSFILFTWRVTGRDVHAHTHTHTVGGGLTRCTTAPSSEFFFMSWFNLWILSQNITLVMLFVYLLGWQSERDREIFHAPDDFHNACKSPRAGPGPHQDPPIWVWRGWHGCTHLSHHLLPPRNVNNKQVWKLWLEPGSYYVMLV